MSDSIRADVLGDAIAAARAALAGPSDEELTQFLFDNFRGPIEFICDAEEVAHVMIRNHIKFARAVLARWGHQPAPPAEGEVAELAAKLRRLAPQNPLGTADPTITRAADLLERQATACAICERERLHQSTRAADLEVERQAAPVPVPVSERLPGPEDCDGGGRCWWWDGEWGLIDQRFADYLVTHWLPAHALPLPQGEVK